MKTAHTPGPWEWHGDYTLRPAFPDPQKHALHTILSPDGPFGFVQTATADTEPEFQACKRLIAAAPELLAAIRCVRDDINMTRAVLMDSVQTHDTYGGWLHIEAKRLADALDELDTAIALTTESEE